MPNNPERPKIKTNRKGKDPKIIGMWKVGRTLGKGACGRVRIARHAVTGQYAAIKIISKQDLHNPEDGEVAKVLRSIEREIVVMKLIDHPNVMRIYDVWETSTHYYIFLEYVDGGELYDHLSKKGVLSVSEAIDYFQQIVSALDYCHRFSIAHRDLKPENILLDKTGTVKLADFGMAAWLRTNASGLLETQCGSPHYAAPEIFIGNPYNGAAVDVWACGVVLYSLLTGSLPFDADSTNELAIKICTDNIPIPLKLDASARDLLGRMLERDVSRRITIPEIKTHEFFLLRSPRPSPTPPSLTDIVQSARSPKGIDEHLFANLRTLWYGIPDAILRENLLSDEPTWEKAVYHLLVEYRTKHAIARVERNKWITRTAPAKATPALSSPERSPEPNELPPRADPPTPRRAIRKPSEAQNKVVTESCHGAENVRTYRSTGDKVCVQRSPAQLSPGLLLSPLTAATPLLPPGSPLWTALGMPPFPDCTAIRDPAVQDFVKEMEKRVQTMIASGRLPSSPAATQTTVHLAEDHTALHAAVNKVGSGRAGLGIIVPGANGQGGSAASGPLIGQSARHRSSTVELDLKGEEQSWRWVTHSPHSLSSENHSPDPDRIRQRASPSGKENQESQAKRVPDRGPARKSSMKSGTDARQPHSMDPRKVQIVEPPADERHRLRRHKSLGSPTASSPVFSDASTPTPKSPLSPAWFGNLFKIRPATFILFSVHDVPTTRGECTRLLVSLGVEVALTRTDALGVLKCRAEDDWRADDGLRKSTRFRVEMQQTDRAQAVGGFESVVTLVQEKGALNAFKTVYSRLRGVWDLDALRLPSHEPSPALDASGRFDGLMYG